MRGSGQDHASRQRIADPEGLVVPEELPGLLALKVAGRVHEVAKGVGRGGAMFHVCLAGASPLGSAESATS